MARTDQLAWHDWGSVLRDLGRDRDWVGNGSAQESYCAGGRAERSCTGERRWATRSSHPIADE